MTQRYVHLSPAALDSRIRLLDQPLPYRILETGRVSEGVINDWNLTGGEAGIRTLGRALRPYNGLANRRLQPLGHLTDPVSIRRAMSCGKEIVPANVPEIGRLSLLRAKHPRSSRRNSLEDAQARLDSSRQVAEVGEPMPLFKTNLGDPAQPGFPTPYVCLRTASDSL
jgi:hypothetical protein